MSNVGQGCGGFGSSADVMANLSRRIDATKARFTSKIPNPPTRRSSAKARVIHFPFPYLSSH